MRVLKSPTVLVLGLLAVLVGCPGVTPEPAKLSGIKLATDKVTLEVNKTQTLTATPVDQFDKPFNGATVTWSVTDSSVASINAQTGFLTAKKFGVVKVKATTDGFSGEAEVIVKNPPNPTKSASERQVKRTTPQNSLAFGYLEYKPQDWGEDPTKTYPLLIFLHGSGEKGDGSSGDLNKLLTTSDGGPANQINFNAINPNMVVLTPQLKSNGNVNQPWDKSITNTLISKAINELRVDPKRVYLTGSSLGGGGVWYFAGDSAGNASKLAAILPLDGSDRGETYTTSKACNIASANVAVLTIHSSTENLNNEGFVTVANSQRWVDNINGTGSGCTKPNPQARLQRELSVDHFGIIGKVFDPSYRIDGKNVYDWLLQYKRP